MVKGKQRSGWGGWRVQRGGLHVLSESGASFRGRIPLPTALIPPLGTLEHEDKLWTARAVTLPRFRH